MLLGKLDSGMQKNEPGSLSYTIRKNKLKMDERPKCKKEIIKVLEEKIGNNLFNLSHSNFLLDMSPKAREIKAKRNDWDLIKKKTSVQQRKQSTKLKGSEQEKIPASDILNKGLVFKIYKELTKLNTQKTNNPVKKWAEDMHRHFSKEDTQMVNRHMRRCSTSLIIREIQIKTTMRYHLTPFRMAKIDNSGNKRCW